MIEADRLIAADSPVFKDEDIIDRAIRPKRLEDYQGQDHVRDQWKSLLKRHNYVMSHLITH